MDFALSQDQQMLADSLRRVISEQWTHAHRRYFRQHAEVQNQAWQQLAELGVLGLTIPADFDGFGEPPSSLLPVHQELGRGIVSEPVIPSAIIGAKILEHSPQHQHLLAGIATGEVIVTLADCDGDTPTQFLQQGDQYILQGSKTAIWHLASASHCIVRAESDGETVLILLEKDQLGATCIAQDVPTYDSARTGSLEWKQHPVAQSQIILQGSAADTALALGKQWGIAALCAHGAGAMERLIEMTVDYLAVRKQFGTALINFQALQHKLADMQIAKEMALSMAYVAVAALSETDATRRQERISSAKIEVAKAGRQIGQMAVQLHGGMGMTDELEVGDYFKRLTAIDTLLGDTAEHLAILARMELSHE